MIISSVRTHLKTKIKEVIVKKSNNIKDGKLLYHLTRLDNLASILTHGLQPRCELTNTNFKDIADGEILSSRQQHNLDRYVPFHFFAKTPLIMPLKMHIQQRGLSSSVSVGNWHEVINGK